MTTELSFECIKMILCGISKQKQKKSKKQNKNKWKKCTQDYCIVPANKTEVFAVQK